MKELFNSNGIKITVENPNPDWEMWVSSSFEKSEGNDNTYSSGMIFGIENIEGEKNLKEVVKNVENMVQERCGDKFGDLEKLVFMQTEVENRILQSDSTNKVVEFAVSRDSMKEDFYGMTVSIEAEKSTILIIRRENGSIEFNIVNTQEGSVTKVINKILGVAEFRVIIDKPDSKFEKVNKAIDIYNEMVKYMGEVKKGTTISFYTTYVDLSDDASIETTEM